MALTLVSAPTVQPLTESEAWDHLRANLLEAGVEPSDKTHIQTLIAAATAYLDARDGILGRALVTQTWDYTIDAFPCADFIRLPLPPVQSITSITYVDENGSTQTFASSKYRLSADKHQRPRADLAYGEVWPTTRRQRDAVTIRLVCGYASGNSPEDASAVPASIKDAMKLLIGHWYEHREEILVGVTPATLPMGVDALLAPFRVY